MSRRKTLLWLCLLGAVTTVTLGYRLVWQYGNGNTPVDNLTIRLGMGPDLTTRNDQLSFGQLEQLITETINNGDWQTSGSSSDKPFHSIVIACSADGCKTFTYDVAGNLIPFTENEFDLTNSSDDPVR